MTTTELHDEITNAMASEPYTPPGLQRDMVLPKPAPSALRHRVLDTVWADDIELRLDEGGVIEGVIPRFSLVVFQGVTGTGKTFAVLDMACHVAAGLPWRGRDVERGTVVYIAAEAPASLERRVLAWKKHHDIAELPLLIVRSTVDLLHPKADVNALLDLIRATEVSHGRVALVVVDTVARAMAGGNENAPDDMGAFVGNVARLRDEAQTAVLVVHHAGKDVSKGARGHSSLKAAADVELEITEGSICITKSRDDESGHVFGFKLEVVELGISAKGKPITTCVAVEAEAPTKESGKPKQPGLTSLGRLALDALQCAVGRHGEKPPVYDATRNVAQAVPIDCWREHFMQRYGRERVDDDEFAPAEDRKKAQAAKRQAWKSGRGDVLGKHAARADGNWVWLL